MLSSVMNIVAKPLEHSLRTYQRSDPKSQEIEPLLRAIKDSIPLSRRTGAADHVELEAWSGVQQHQHNHQNVGFANTLRQTLQSLVQWSIHPAMDRPPPTYTHRQILVALIILGAKRLLQLIYEDIRQHSEAGSGSIVYDVAANLVCAPDANDSPWANALNFMDNSGNMPAPIQKKLTMREVLKSDAENCKRLQKTDVNLAEIVVRLHRKVESQMVVAQAAAIQADTMLQNDLGLGLDGGTGSLDDAMAAATANVVAGDGMSVDNVSLDLGMAGDMGLGGPSNAGGGLDLGDNDLFSGLDTGDDFQWDNMDLS